MQLLLFIQKSWKKIIIGILYRNQSVRGLPCHLRPGKLLWINDTGKGITNIDYNYLNLPKTVTKTGQTISYNYSGDGSKLNATFSSSKVYDYVSGLSYLNDNLEFIPTAEGRILPPGTAVNPPLNGNAAAPAGVTNGFYRYEYDIKDHLGNLRVACRCGEKNGAISSGDAYSPIVVQENHYDPWGLGLPLNADNEKVGGSPADRYTYNGKEKQQDVGWLDYGARMYDPQIGRWNMVDPTSSISFSQSPFQYVLNNPIKFIDPFGLWEVTSTGYSTTNSAEISRFMNYASFERNGLNNNPSYSQASGFIKGEMSGKGGTLSNGGKLISSIQETGYRTKAGDIWWGADEQSVSDAWHSVQGDLTQDALDPRSVGYNLLYLAYAGGDNPQTYSHNYDYSYIPKNGADFPAIGHDRRYDNLGIKGFPGLFGDTRAIGADWRFVAEEFAVLASSSSLFVKSQAFILGGGLGFLASFKTLGQSQVPGGYGQMYVWYQISNNGGVNNIPSKTKE